MPVKKKPGRREERWHTVRVSAECHRSICLIARGLDRSKGWVVEHAVLDYAIVRDLDEQAQLRRPKLEVRA